MTSRRPFSPRSSRRSHGRRRARAPAASLAGGNSSASSRGPRRSFMCPFAIRVFPTLRFPLSSAECFARLQAAATSEPSQRPGDLILHTWRDATLREIAQLLQPKLQPLMNELSSSEDSHSCLFQLTFSSVYPNNSGAASSREIGRVFVKGPGSEGDFPQSDGDGDDSLTLAKAQLEIGDSLNLIVSMANGQKAEN